MRWPTPSRMSPSVLFLLAILTFITFSRVVAQDLPSLTGDTKNANNIPAATPQATEKGDSASPTNAPSATGGDSKSESGSAAESAAETKTDASDSGSVPTDLPAATSFAGTAADTSGDKPTITSLGGGVTLSGLPTLAGVFSYPPPSVPPIAKAPYMQHSNLPEGTVFIAVGAALGFFAVVIIAWRILVAWSINRSVRRSATKGYAPMGETTYDKGERRKSTLYSTVAPAGSTMSLEKLVSTRAGTSISKTPRENSSLFFSPTAGAGMHSASNRNSGYLPSGYYASSTAAPGGGTGMTTLGGGGDRGSKLRPHSGVYSTTRHMDPSPPDSPDVRPSTAGLSTAGSRSSLNLSTTTGTRAPSTYLDDLMSTPPPLPQHGNIGGRPKRDSMGRNQYRD